MGNLGWYQWITTTSKKVGGPLQLLGIVAAGGAIAGSLATKGFDAAKQKITIMKEAKEQAAEASIVYTVTKEGRSNEGLEFNIGDQFRVLERDGDAVLIEKLRDENNPYFVSAKFLSSISDYSYYEAISCRIQSI